MPITVSCKCGKVFRAKDKMAGRKVRCPACGGPALIGMSRKYGVNPTVEPKRRNNLGYIAAGTSVGFASLLGFAILRSSGRTLRHIYRSQQRVEQQKETQRQNEASRQRRRENTQRRIQSRTRRSGSALPSSRILERRSRVPKIGNSTRKTTRNVPQLNRRSNRIARSALSRMQGRGHR